jgi:very-short-patch-repair endonuclease
MMKRSRKTKSPPEVRQSAKELRKSQTPAEEKLWKMLRNRKPGGYKFRRQHPIGGFIVDFYCDEVELMIELDGEIHNRQKGYDQARDRWLSENGYQVLRFGNEVIGDEEEGVVADIISTCERDS